MQEFLMVLEILALSQRLVTIVLGVSLQF